MLGGDQYLQTGGDGVASANALVPSAVLFGLGETGRLYKAFRESGLNVWQATGRAASAVIPLVAAYFLNDKVYNPFVDLGMIAPWAAAQKVTEIGDRNQEYNLGSEILGHGRGTALAFVDANTSDEDLARYAGRIARKKKK